MTAAELAWGLGGSRPPPHPKNSMEIRGWKEGDEEKKKRDEEENEGLGGRREMSPLTSNSCIRPWCIIVSVSIFILH
jgi:hypothetical protein